MFGSLSLGLGLSAPRQGVGVPSISDIYAQPDDVAAFVDFNRSKLVLTTVDVGSIAAASAASLKAVADCTFADLFEFTRASVAWYKNAAGVLVQAAVDAPRFDYTNGRRQLRWEKAATNLFASPFTPAGQTATVVNATTYTVSVVGTGSLTLSGAVAGVVTEATPLTFAASGTSLVAVVAGSLQSMQCETGSVATSPIAGTRAADSIRLAAKPRALLGRSDVGVFLRAEKVAQSSSLLGAPSTGSLFRVGSGSKTFLRQEGSGITNLTSNFPSNTSTDDRFGAAIGWNASGRSMSGNGVAVTTDANANVAMTDAWLGRVGSTAANGAGWLDVLGIIPERPSDTRIAQLAVGA